jgi:BCD family chlorophyll transporter-like MFS transporter
VAVGGVLRDLTQALADRHMLPPSFSNPAAGYTLVYTLEIFLLLATLFVMAPLIRPEGRMAVVEAL